MKEHRAFHHRGIHKSWKLRNSDRPCGSSMRPVRAVLSDVWPSKWQGWPKVGSRLTKAGFQATTHDVDIFRPAFVHRFPPCNLRVFVCLFFSLGLLCVPLFNPSSTSAIYFCLYPVLLLVLASTPLRCSVHWPKWSDDEASLPLGMAKVAVMPTSISVAAIRTNQSQLPSDSRMLLMQQWRTRGETKSRPI